MSVEFFRDAALSDVAGSWLGLLLEWAAKGALVLAPALEGDEVHHAAVGLHLARRGTGKRTVDQRRYEVPHRVPATRGKRRLRVEDRPNRRGHRDRSRRWAVDLAECGG